MCANLIGHGLISEQEIPVSVWYQHTGNRRRTDPKDLSTWPAGQHCSLSVCAIMTWKACDSHLPLPHRETASQGSDLPVPHLSLKEKKTEAHGLRGKVITLKSLSKWVLQGCLSKQRQAG